jgi:hypothetical protein
MTLLIMQFPPIALRSIIHRISPCPRLRVNFRNNLIFYGEELLDPRPTPKLEDHPLSLSATAYSIHSQLPFISGGRLLHPQRLLVTDFKSGDSSASRTVVLSSQTPVQN